MVDKKINEKIGGGNSGPGQPGANESSRAGGSSSGRNSNSTGEGLVTVPPDVNKFLTEADDAFKKNDLMKFQMITDQENVPLGSELYKRNASRGATQEPAE